MCAALGRAHEFFLVLKKAGFSDELIQEVINSKDNAMAKKMLAAISVKAVKKSSRNIQKTTSVLSDVVWNNNSFFRIVPPQRILRLISGENSLTLKALKGKRLIYNSKRTFKSFIDQNFVNWNMNKKGIATPETSVQVHEMVQNGTFMDIFRTLPGTWNQKWLSQDQIIEFCETLPNWLRQEGSATFFLTKKDESKLINEDKPEDNLVVVYVYVFDDGLDVFVYRLEDDDVWCGESRHRVVSPQLMPSVS